MAYKMGTNIKFVVRDDRIQSKYTIKDFLQLGGGFLAAYTIFYALLQLF